MDHHSTKKLSRLFLGEPDDFECCRLHIGPAFVRGTQISFRSDRFLEFRSSISTMYSHVPALSEPGSAD